MTGSKTVDPLRLNGSGTELPSRVNVLLATEQLVLGEFQCGPDDPLWKAENQIGDLPHLVWPIATVEITRTGRARECGDPTAVILYDAGTSYRRRLVSPCGDRAVFVAVHPDLLADTGAATFGRFPVGRLRSRAVDWLARQVAVVAARTQPDRLRAEELVLIVLAHVAGRLGAAPKAPGPRALERVEDARLLLGGDLGEPLLVSDVAATLHVSPYHLSRQFHALTGTTMHRYRSDLRVRAALQTAIDHPAHDLSRIAAEHGFANHSHFTASCRRLLGQPPTALMRAVLSAAG